MREVTQLGEREAAASTTVTLAFDDRKKARQRVRLDDDSWVGLLLPRGTVLRDGDRLLADDGLVIAVKAAAETLSSVDEADPLRLSRAAYHLGNRHVPLQIRPGVLRYQHDHVLDDMVRALGLAVHTVDAVFEPEPGAYGHGKRTGASSDHDHDHDHDG